MTYNGERVINIVNDKIKGIGLLIYSLDDFIWVFPGIDKLIEGVVIK